MKKILGIIVLMCALAGSVFAGEVTLPLPENWQWHWYYIPGLPDGLFPSVKQINGTLELPDGRKVPGHKFAYKGNIVNLYNFIKPRPAVLERTVVTSDFNVPQAGRAVIGAGVDWKFKLFVNGELKYDTTPYGNGEIPTSANDHLIEFDVKAGRNQLIWEVFGGSFDFHLAVEQKKNIPSLKIIGQPLVTYPDSKDNAVSIVFATSRNTPAGVDFRRKGTAEWKRIYNSIDGQIRRDCSVHYLRLSDLQADCEYEYRIVLIDELRQHNEYAASNVYTFKTLPSAEKMRPVSFIVTSDLQVPVAERRKFMQTILDTPEARNMDFFAFAGDIDWTSNFDKAVMRDFVSIFQEATNNAKPLVMVRGNHEAYGKDTNRYFTYFPAVPGGKEGYGLFRCGDICFVILDFVDDAGQAPAPSTRSLHNIDPYLAEQTAWLKKALETPEFQTARVRIVMAHATPLGHGGGFMPGNVRNMIDPLFSSADPKYKIHLWIGGHVHRAFRSVPGKNLYYSVVGKDGKKLDIKHPAIGEKYHFPVVVMGGPSKAVAENMRLTSMLVKVDGNVIEVIHRDRNNRVFDHIRITPDGKMQELVHSEEFKQYSY